MTTLEEVLKEIEKIDNAIDVIERLDEVDIEKIEKTIVKIVNFVKGIFWRCKETECKIYPIEEQKQEEPITFKMAYKCPDGVVKGNTKCYSKIGEIWRREPTQAIKDELDKLGCSHPEIEQVIREREKDASTQFKPCIYYDGKFIQKKRVVTLYYLIEYKCGPLWAIFDVKSEVKRLKQTSEYWRYIDSDWVVEPVSIVEEYCCKEYSAKHKSESEKILAEYRLDKLVEEKKKKIVDLYKKGFSEDEISKELNIAPDVVKKVLDEIKQNSGNPNLNNRYTKFEIGIRPLVDPDDVWGYFEEEKIPKENRDQINKWVKELKSLPNTKIENELRRSELGLFEWAAILTICANVAKIARLILKVLASKKYRISIRGDPKGTRELLNKLEEMIRNEFPDESDEMMRKVEA